MAVITVRHKKDASADVANEILGPIAPSLSAMGPEDRQLFLRVFQEYMKDRGETDRSTAGNFGEQLKRGYQDVLQSTTVAVGNTLGVLPDNASEDDVFFRQIRGIREGIDPGLSPGIMRGPQLAARMAPAAAGSIMVGAPGAAVAAEFGIAGVAGAILKGGGPGAYWYAQTQPGLYADLRGEGIDRDISMRVSQVASIPIALVEQFNDIGGNFTKAAIDGAKEVAIKSVTKYLKQQGKESIKQFGAEYSEEVGQALLELSAKAVADHLDKTNPGIDWRAQMQAKASELGDAAIALPFMMAPASALNVAGGLANTLTNKEAYKQAKLQQTQQPAATAAPQQPAAQPDLTATVTKAAETLWANSPDLAQAIVDKVADGGRISRSDWAKAREASPTLPNKVSSNARDEFAKVLGDRRPKAPDPTAETAAATTTVQQPESVPVEAVSTAEPATATAAQGETTAVTPPTPQAVQAQPPVAIPEPEAPKPIELEDVTPEVADQIRKNGDPIEDADRNETGWIGQRTPTGMTLVHPADNKVKRFEIDSKVGGDFPSKLAEAKQWAADNKVKITPRVTPKVDKPIKSEAPAKKGFKRPEPKVSEAKTADEFTSLLEGMALAEEGRAKDPNFPKMFERVKDGRGREFSIRKTPKNGWTVVEHDPSGAEIEQGGDPRGGGYSKQEAIKQAVASARFPASMDQDVRAGDKPSDNVVSTSSQEGPNRGQEETDAQGQAQADGRQEGLLSPSESPAAGDTTAPAPKPASITEAGADYAAKLRDKITQRLGGKSEPQPQADTKAEAPKPKRTFKKSPSPEAKPSTQANRGEESPRERAARLAKSKAIVSVEINGEQAQAKVLRANEETLTLQPIGDFDFMENIDSNVAWVREVNPKPAAAPKTEASPQTEQDRLRAELAAKAKAFADAARSKLYSNPLDPELVGLAADMTLTAIKLGAVKFKAFVQEMADTLGRELTARSARYLRAAWDIVREDFPDAKLDESSDVDSVLQELADEKREPTPEPRVGDGAGEPRTDAAAVSGGPTQDAQGTREGARDEGGSVLPDTATTEGVGAEPGGSGTTGTGDAGTDTGEPKLAGSGTADGGRAGKPQEVQAADSTPSVDLRNHTIEPGDVLAVGSETQSIKNNVAAIELLQRLERDSRNATPDEKKVLAKFVGWGKLSQAFDRVKGEAMAEQRKYGRDANWEKKWGTWYTRLKELLTDEEWETARDSTINAHYTSRSIIEKMWGLATALGFKGGRVLEPGAGIGHFAGLAPTNLKADTKFVLVERDALSSRLLAKLYPQADVVASAMEDAKLAPASVDMVIGNVPFAKTVPSNDPMRRYGRELNLHNYFIARSLDAVKPGGFVIAISTHNTMDSEVDQRKFLATKGDLIGAIRLPKNAFEENAGTEVVTDILVFRRPINDERIGQAFDNTVELEMPTANGGTAKDRINEYFVANPEMVLGTNSMTGTMYKSGKNQAEYTVEPTPGDLNAKIQAAVDRMPRNLMSQDMATGDVVEQNSALEKREGYLRLEGGKLSMASGGAWIDLTEGLSIENYPSKLTSKAGLDRARDYIAVRDAYSKLRETMLDPAATDEDIAKQQRVMGKAYDSYVKKHGNVSGQKTAIFAGEPEYYRLLSLENEKANYNPQTKKIDYTYSKAAVFTTRTLGPRMPPTSVDTAKDALWVSMGYRGGIDIPYMAELTGQSQDEIIKALSDDRLAFRDPASQQWTLRERYLSGNVKKKLQAAEVAAADDPAYQANVDALKEVQPPPVAIANVGVELGANWIPDNVLTHFARKLFDDPKARVTYNPHSDSFEAGIDRSLTSVRNKYAVTNESGKVFRWC
jgi:hypothetical protein